MIKTPTCSLALIFFSIFSVVDLSAQSQEKIPPNLLKSDFQTLRTKLESSQAGLYQYTSKDSLDRIFTRIEESLNEPMTSHEFFLKVSPLNKYLRNVHNLVWASEAFEKNTETGLPRFPLDIHWSDGNMYVLRNNSSTKEIVEGSVIKTINGVDVNAIFNTIVDNVTRDGFNETYPIARASKMFGYYYAELIGSPSTFQVEIATKEPITRHFDLQGLTATEIKKNRLARYQRKYRQYGEDWELNADEPALLFEFKENVAIMAIHTFWRYHIEASQEYHEFFSNAFSQLASANVTDLVIDLRNNHGGHDNIAMAAMSHLRTDSFNYYKDRHAIIKPKGKVIKNGDYYTIQGRGEWTGAVIPAKSNFSGNIYVLINAFTVSAGGEFAGHLKNTGRAVFIGEETGGNPVSFTGGQSVRVDLPNTHVTAVIPIVFVETNVAFKNTGRGVMPDFEKKPSVEEILAGKDVEMQFVMDLIKTRNK